MRSTDPTEPHQPLGRPIPRPAPAAPEADPKQQGRIITDPDGKMRTNIPPPPPKYTYFDYYGLPAPRL